MFDFTKQSKARIVLRSCAIALALLQAWAYRYQVYMEDTWSYLDIADKYLAGDFANALSSYWSPLYSWLIAFCLFLFHPATCEKFVVLKLINFCSFLFVIFAFELLLNQVISWYSEDTQIKGLPLLKVSASRVELWSYIVFIMMSLSVGAVWKDTPDLLMSGFLYAASALTLSFWRGQSGRAQAALIGFSLALGYLCKAVIFPLTFVYLFLLLVSPQNKSAKLKAILTVVAAFGLLAGPYITAISLANHRLMFSNTMQYNYALWVLRCAPFRHALALRSPDQLPMQYNHPSQVIFAEPQVFYFAEPIHATFATHYDPPYWFDGITVNFDGVRQFVATVASISVLVRLFFGWLFLGWLVLLIGCRSGAFTLKSIDCRLPLFMPAFAGLTLYCIGLNCYTLYSERYFPGFFVLWFLGLLGSLRLPDSAKVRKVLLVSTIVSLLGLGWRFTNELGTTIGALQRSAVNEDCLILQKMTELGLAPGALLANMDPYRKVGWAQMGQFRVVADIIDDASFWKISASQREALYSVLRAKNIKVLTYANGDNPPKEYPPGWQQVAGTKLWFYKL